VPEGRLVLGKHSGRHALKARCEELGAVLTREQLDLVYTEFTALADHRKKGLMDEEILALVQKHTRPQEARRESADDALGVAQFS